ncbi:MAG TPA: hypothetical protein VN636_06470 [Acidimicrobiia bacterium]|nr:hypothetical protein [Acidimicrobiia bacterium]
MIVTGAQPVGSRGVSAVQATVTDAKDTARAASPSDPDQARHDNAKPGEPQPVVFPRSGVGLDQRPVELRRQQAAARYRDDGGDGDRSRDRD